MTTTGRPPLERGHWLLLLIGLIVLLAYGDLAAAVLPQRLVSLTAGTADASTQLNAVTSTRAALLGVFVPLVVLLGGIAAFLAYRETAGQNRHTNEQARQDRDETRRLRRAEVYAELLSACQQTWKAALELHTPERADPDYVLGLLHTNYEKRVAMDLAHDRVRLLGSDEVQASAIALTMHVGVEVVTRANAQPRLTEEEWTRITVTDYARLNRAFVNATRGDLAPTR